MSAYAVQCPEYTTKPVKERASAERQLAGIEEAGHCKERHEVVEVSK